MRKILLDTSFIITCAKQKIDFFDELIGNQILIPEQVLHELARLKTPNSELARKILEKSKFKKINLEKGKTTDNKIINFAKQNPDAVVATLDREIQNKTLNKKLIIRGKKKLEII